MRAALVRSYGPPESVGVELVDDPTPAAGEVVIEVRAAAVNFPDVLLIRNEYQVHVNPPFIPGSEFAGTVRDVADDVTEIRPGDRVLGATFIGAFAELVAAPAAGLLRLPKGVQFREAAAFWVTYSTAYHALRSVAQVAPGDWVTVLGAAGGVGMAAIDVARALGGRVLAAASSVDKLRACRERGAEATVDYATEDLKMRMRELTGGGADVVIDPVGGPYSEQALRSTRWGGRFVVVGFASGTIPSVPLNLVLLKGAIVRGFDLRTFGEHAPAELARDRRELLELVGSGQLRPLVSAVFPLERVGDALAHLGSRRAIGKVVVEP
ncbi:MAG TPA: NADPH:quinone oxidoreductase family protein [Acidimicrobiales bacterium]|nr:NADPH:quinone oxidoreductase family protein [Acidimicrobiales bacterium]